MGSNVTSPSFPQLQCQGVVLFVIEAFQKCDICVLCSLAIHTNTQSATDEIAQLHSLKVWGAVCVIIWTSVLIRISVLLYAYQNSLYAYHDYDIHIMTITYIL